MIDKLYHLLPFYIQNLLLSVYGYFNDKRRYGSNYCEIEEEVTKRGLLVGEDLRKLREARLKEILVKANKSSYWSRIFQEYKVDVASQEPEKELAKLPILTKQDVRRYADEIKVDSLDLISVHTSGTTGAGLIFFETREAEQERWSVWWRYRHNLGINKGDWCGLFGGRTIIHPRYNGKKIHRVNYSSKQVLFSCYHLSIDTVKYYIEELNRRELKWLHGYPSFISEVAHLAKVANLNIEYKIAQITLGAESLNENQARVIVDFFGVQPKQHYGLAESVANFHQVAEGNSLYVDEDFAFVEFIPLSNDPDIYKIIGTNFSNSSFPLLRYDTGDIASGLDENVMPRTLESVDGRKEDFVILPNGSKVGRLDHIFKDAVYIDEAQIIQDVDLSLQVNLVVNHMWNDKEHRQTLDREFRERVGNDIKIYFKKVDSIKRTKSGKLRFVISKVNK